MSFDTWLVVVNWNGAHLLPRCLASLTHLTRPAQVIVVDNGSTDASAATVASFPQVAWLPLEDNIGFAAANNLGIRRALESGARWIAVVNSDVELAPDWLDLLIAAGETHPEVGILGGLLVFAHAPDLVNSTGLVLDGFGRARDRDFEVPLRALSTPDGPVTGMTGGAALLRAEALRKVGLFDPAYFAYYEDVDFSLRAAAAGYRAWYVSAARGVHGYGKSFGSGSPRQRYLLARNHMRLLAARRPLLQVALFLPSFTLLRALLKAPWELLRGHPALAAAHFRGALAGAWVASLALVLRLFWREAIPPGARP